MSNTIKPPTDSAVTTPNDRVGLGATTDVDGNTVPVRDVAPNQVTSADHVDEVEQTRGATSAIDEQTKRMAQMLGALRNHDLGDIRGATLSHDFGRELWNASFEKYHAEAGDQLGALKLIEAQVAKDVDHQRDVLAGQIGELQDWQHRLDTASRDYSDAGVTGSPRVPHSAEDGSGHDLLPQVNDPRAVFEAESYKSGDKKAAGNGKKRDDSPGAPDVTPSGTTQSEPDAKATLQALATDDGQSEEDGHGTPASKTGSANAKWWSGSKSQPPKSGKLCCRCSQSETNDIA